MAGQGAFLLTAFYIYYAQIDACGKTLGGPQSELNIDDGWRACYDIEI